MGIKPLVIDTATHASQEYGRSDAFQSRCMEVMQSLGAPIEQLEHMGKKLYGRTFWEISSDSSRRTAHARFYPEFLDYDKDYSLAVRQGLIGQVLIHDMEKHREGFSVQWNTQFVSMELPNKSTPLNTVVLRNSVTGAERTVATKYVVAADGARSDVRHWARDRFGVKLEGESLPVTWCVLDAVGLKSDHPDLERLCIVRSEDGIVLVIPREPINGKPAARFDIQIQKAKNETTEADATRMIKQIFHPFKVEWDEVNWWSIYDVGQRLINQYSIQDSVFFLGDACHTHSPRAGLGLNTALLEGQNLAWKMALVLKGLAKPEVLSTYATERHAVAKQLVEMDRRLVGLYAGLEAESNMGFSSAETAEWLQKLRLYQAANYAYQAGASIVYSPNVVTVTKDGKPDSMTIGQPGVAVGSRTRPAQVTRLSDSVPVPILPPFDGRFTIYFLVGDLSSSEAFGRLQEVDTYIRKSNGSIFSRFGKDIDVHAKPIAERMPHLRIPLTSTSNEARPDASFAPGRSLYTYEYDEIPQIMADVQAAPHSLFRVSSITTSGIDSPAVQEKLLEVLNPRYSSPEEAKHSRIFHPAHFYCDDLPIVSPYRQTAPEAGLVFEHPLHTKWGVDVSQGSIIIARPDAHVALKTTGFGVEAWKEVEAYFEGALA
ncbi:FAD binding domain-containing protein [Crucibulum laeve]|uniref:FAD binding domain-containing protein n=1 Tax=Crucibulum laeve TaxID=68775 RepID=A0A5C3LT22_9AGAR|nr:FAD binding domain-containing protein [Crucibulum laeve]